MMKKIKKNILLALVLIAVVGITACNKQSEKEEDKKEMVIYYLSKDDTQIVSEIYKTETKATKKLVEELMSEMQKQPENLELKAVIPSTFEKIECTIEEKQITLNFDEAYLELDVAKEILTRAAIVRTLTQIPEIEIVSMQVNKRPLEDSTGALVGIMTADMFIDNAGTEINTYEKVKLKLYFANEKGDKLVPVSKNFVYSSNISLEKLVVEKLIEGLKDETCFPTMNPDTKIISVTTKDGVCYVNLNETFLVQTTNVIPEVTMYSIINSLVELSNVNKVQILIDGESDRKYRDNIELSKIYERNLDIVQEEK